MVSKARGKGSAKNRLKGRRVAIPKELVEGVQLPEGCPVKRPDLFELLNGLSSLEQLLACKNIVSAFGATKEQKQAVAGDIPGLEAIVSMMLNIMIQQGSKPLHEPIKIFLQLIPEDTCMRMVADFIPNLLSSTAHEMVLTMGTLSGCKSATTVLSNNFCGIVCTAAPVLDKLVESVSWQYANGMSAEVTKVVKNETQAEGGDDGGEGEAVHLAEPEMLRFCLHSLYDFLIVSNTKVKDIISARITDRAGDEATTFTNLVNCLLRIIGNGAVQKDSLTTASIILCSFIQQSHADPEAVAVQLAAIAGCQNVVNFGQYTKHVEGGQKLLFSAGCLDGIFSLDHDNLPVFSQQTMFRAALSAGENRVLTSPLELVKPESESAQSSLMFSLVFDRVCLQCGHTSDLFLVCYGLQTLAYCIDIVLEVIRKSFSEISGGAVTELPTSSSVVISMFESGVKFLWPHCEDPFQGISDQTKDMFDTLTDLREIGEIMRKYEKGLLPASMLLSESSITAEERKEVFSDLLNMALAVRPNRKARYRVLVALVPRLGFRWILSTVPDFMKILLEAMREQSVGSSAALLLLELLNNASGEKDISWWLDPCIDALKSSDTRIHYALCTYALPMIGRTVPGSIQQLLEALQVDEKEADVVHNLYAITAVMKIARRLGSETKTLSTSNETNLRFLRAALLHVNDDMRLNALEMICINIKLSEPVSREELDLIKVFLTFNMKSSSSFYRQRSMELLKKLFVRLRMSRHNVLVKARKTEETTKKKGGAPYVMSPEEEVLIGSVDDFLSWLTVTLTAALYPGGSFERNIMALELFITVIDVWMPTVAQHPIPVLLDLEMSPEDDALVRELLFRPEAVHTVINAIVNSFDHVRKSAFELISRFPTPLPGIDTEESVHSLMKWAQTLVSSPRARESDAGSLIMQLVHTKYVKSLGWYLSPLADTCTSKRAAQTNESPSLYFVRELLTNVDNIADSAVKNFEGTFSSSFAQGLLLCLRYVLRDAPIPSLLKAKGQGRVDEGQIALWKDTTGHILRSMRRIAAITIGAMAGCPPERVGGCEGDKPIVVGGASVSTGLFGSMYSKAMPTPHSNQRDSLSAIQRNTSDAAGSATATHTHVASLSQFDQGEEDGDEESQLAALGPKEQLLVVSCWLTLKEVALVLGSAVSIAPLESEALLSRSQLVLVGNMLLDIVFSTLHNGAIEKARLGFQKLCEKLLQCTLSTFRKLPGEWLDKLLVRLYDHDVPVVRRSSQLSFSIIAVLASEPSNARHTLLENAMGRLLYAAHGSGAPLEGAEIPAGCADHDEGAKLRARVHALNILRHLFLDKDLAKEITVYLPAAMMCAIQGFGASTWAVRNSSTLAFSVLLSRSMGGAHQRKTFGAGEFFLRYPSLCPFLLQRLVMATDSLTAGSDKTGALHPELQPVLVLLAQLAPSSHVRQDQEHIRAFIPIIQRCVNYHNSMVRSMAARALLPFIPLQDLPRFLHMDLLCRIPARAPADRSRAFARHNEVHGLVEQVQCLLKYQCEGDDVWPDMVASLQKGGDWDSLYTMLETMVPEWLADSRIPPPINLVLLKSVTHLLFSDGSRIVSAATSSLEAVLRLRAAVLAVVGACLSLLSSKEATCNTPEPMLQSLLGLASRFASRQLLTDAQSSADWTKKVNQVLNLLDSPCYEVRWMVMRAIKAAVLGREGMHIMAQDVQAVVLRRITGRLLVEDNGGCLRKMLRVLLELGKGGISSLSDLVKEGESEMKSVLWERCVLLEQSTDSKVQERGTAFSGHVLSHLWQSAIAQKDAEGWAAVMDKVLDNWLNCIEEVADEAKHIDQRGAAVESICRSLILSWKPWLLPPVWRNVATKATLRAWILSLTLLQDDDDETRVKMAVAVSEAVFGHARDSGLQPAKAIELLFHHVSKHYAEDAGYATFLEQSLRRKRGSTVDVPVGGDIVPDEVMARRLFEKECDNFQCEDLVVLQLCAHYKRTLRGGAFDFKAFSDSTSDLVSFLKNLADLQEGTCWAGGVSNRMDLFLEMYRLILVVYSEAGEKGTGNAEDMDKLCAASALMVEQQTHPLLRNALLQVVCLCGAEAAESKLGLVNGSKRFDSLHLMFLTSF